MTIREHTLDGIHPNPFQTREREDLEHVGQVALSIARSGLLQTPVGRSASPGGGVELAFGHTRLAAYKLLAAGGPLPDANEGVPLPEYRPEAYQTMPVDIRELTDLEMFELAVRENLDRKDLTPIEEARAMKVYRERFGKTSEEIGVLFGISASAVRNKLRLLDLPDPVQERMETGELSEASARRLLIVQKVAPTEMDKALEGLAAGADADAVSASVQMAIDQKAVKLVTRWEASKAGERGEIRVRGGWPLSWAPGLQDVRADYALKAFPLVEGLPAAAEMPKKGQQGVMGQILGVAASPGTTTAALADLFDLAGDYADRLMQLVRPPACSACAYHAVLDGAHYCGLKACYDGKLASWGRMELEAVSTQLNIVVYDPERDGAYFEVEETYYPQDDEEVDLESEGEEPPPDWLDESLTPEWQAWLKAKANHLRLRLREKPGHYASPSTGSRLVDLISVRPEAQKQAEKEAKRREEQRKKRRASNVTWEEQARKRRQEWALDDKRRAATKRFVEQHAAPVFAEILEPIKKPATLAVLHRHLSRGYRSRKKLTPAELRVAIAAGLLNGELGSKRADGPQKVAAHLRGLAKELGVRVPADWDAAAAEIGARIKGVSVETDEERDE